MSSSETISIQPITPQEKEAAKLFETLQAKASMPGYKKEMVRRFSSKIESAMAKGYSYEEIAELFKQVDIEIAPSTLKKYHLEVRKQLDVPYQSEYPSEVSSQGEHNGSSDSQNKPSQTTISQVPNPVDSAASSRTSTSEDNAFDAAVNILSAKKR